jgi:CheY-like chemotaxis protein
MDKPPSPRLPSILVVDDNDVTRMVTKWFLANFGYQAQCARSAEEGLALFDPKTHDLVITDNSMPGMSGIQMARDIKMLSPSTPILMYTLDPPDDASDVDLVIRRPAHLLELKDAVDQLLAIHVPGQIRPAPPNPTDQPKAGPGL